MCHPDITQIGPSTLHVVDPVDHMRCDNPTKDPPPKHGISSDMNHPAIKRPN